jgi:type II secretory pathway pseudopilin PulG
MTHANRSRGASSLLRLLVALAMLGGTLLALAPAAQAQSGTVKLEWLTWSSSG